MGSIFHEILSAYVNICSLSRLIAVIVLVFAAEAIDEDAEGNAANDSNKDANDQTKTGWGVLIA